MIARINSNQLAITNNTQLVQGTVGEKIGLVFSQDWSALSKTAVFSSGELMRDVAVCSGEISIPWELLAKDGRRLSLSFHGSLPDGTIVLRTNIASLGSILPSYSPSGEEPEAPSPARADQIQAIAQQAAAEVQALREDAAAGRFKGADGISPTVSVTSIAGGHRISITDAEGTAQFTVPDGAKGDKGDPGDSPVPAAALPLMDGAASAGSAAAYARGDHVHPSDTSRLAANQGAANAGKFMVVGSDGAVIPVTMQVWQGGNY